MRWPSLFCVAVVAFGLNLSPVAHAGPYEQLANTVLASYRTSPAPTPPTPAPAPAGVCENCNGTGKLGDGTVFVICPVCKGTGKTPAKDAAEAPPPRAAYPTRGKLWSGCGGWQHLASGQHAGKFDPAWLQSLSNAELQALHSDDHEGRVKWEYVVRGAGKAPAKSGGCPGGICPTVNSFPLLRIFGR